jgi:hypothetical protein
MSNREYTGWSGTKHYRDDEELVEWALTGYTGYGGGQLERLQYEVAELRKQTALILLAIDREAVVKFCEEM